MFRQVREPEWVLSISTSLSHHWQHGGKNQISEDCSHPSMNLPFMYSRYLVNFRISLVSPIHFSTCALIQIILSKKQLFIFHLSNQPYFIFHQCTRPPGIPNTVASFASSGVFLICKWVSVNVFNRRHVCHRICCDHPSWLFAVRVVFTLRSLGKSDGQKTNRHKPSFAKI